MKNLKSILEKVMAGYHKGPVCMAEHLAWKKVPRGLTFENAFEIYITAMSLAEGDTFLRVSEDDMVGKYVLDPTICNISLKKIGKVEPDTNQGTVSISKEGNDSKGEFFEVTSVSRHDLDELGFDTSDVTDETMRGLASKLSDDYCEQLYWDSLRSIAENLGIPKITK